MGAPMRARRRRVPSLRRLAHSHIAPKPSPLARTSLRMQHHQRINVLPPGWPAGAQATTMPFAGKAGGAAGLRGGREEAAWGAASRAHCSLSVVREKRCGGYDSDLPAAVSVTASTLARAPYLQPQRNRTP
eukprot:scaffold628_cov401-Prasinococcus_capsulatus_cf.AAC.2